MKKIQIIKHKNPEAVNGSGDILFPFENWENTSTGDGWYSKLPHEFYDSKPYYPLTTIHQNPWETLIQLGVSCFDFKEKVQYECPYNKYIHYWSIPIFIFTNNMKFWLNKYKVPQEQMYLNMSWMKKFFPPKIKDSLPFTKIQRALLGPGYTNVVNPSAGNGYLYDAVVRLENEDLLGMKVWLWFTKK